MELHEYPRPTNDTGIGVHWTPGFAAAVGMAKLKEYWLPELRALGVKWVKIYNHDGALDFCELLLGEGILPIVRIYRTTPNPGRLSLKELVTIDSYVRIGVRYFEFNSEPDRDSEWRGGRVPANGLELVAEDTIANCEAILERGGMPGIPALSNGSQWDLVGKIVAMGRRDLFDGPIWQAIHNFSSNRPLDYPYDIGNQEGAAYTERFYQVVSEEAWEEHAWRGRSLQEVNRLRLDRCNPGMSSKDDHACFLAYEYWDSLNRKHLGRSLPILSTESGYLVGEDVDPRYPATSPNLHMAQTLEACRVMMGTSQRYNQAPDYYFCSAFWLFGNAILGSSSTWWEKHAWYSSRWQGGALPVARALKAEPKLTRQWAERGLVGLRVTLRGFILNANEQRTVVLQQNTVEIARTTLDLAGRFSFGELLPGRYAVKLVGTDLIQTVDLPPGQVEVAVNLAVEPTQEVVSRSVVSGKVRGGAGAVVVLVRRSDGEEWVTMAKEDGSYRFVDLPAGTYSVRVNPEGSRVEAIVLNGTNQHEVPLVVAGWGYTVSTASEESGVASFRCAVEGKRGAEVRAHSGSWSSEPMLTGSDPDLGEYECQFFGLEPGHYIITVDGLTDEAGRKLEAEGRVHVDKRRIPLVRFVYSKMDASPRLNQSAIFGHVIGQPISGSSPTSAQSVRLIDEQQIPRQVMVASDGSYRFGGLEAGRYTIELVGAEEATAHSQIALDGTSQVEIDMVVPAHTQAAQSPYTLGEASTPASRGTTSQLGRSTINAHVPSSAGRMAHLLDSAGNRWELPVDERDLVRFDQLAAGTYRLTVEGGYEQGDLHVDGSNGLEVMFTPLLTTWEVQVSNAGSMPGFSAVRVEVQGQDNVPVRIWKDDWDGMVQPTGSRSDLGPFALEFSPLGPGIYMVEPEGLGIWTDVELTGLEAMWVSFRPSPAASVPNVIVPMAGRIETREQRSENNQSESVSQSGSGAVDNPQSPISQSPISQSPISDTPFAIRNSQFATPTTYLWVDNQALSGSALVTLLRFVAGSQPKVGAVLEDAAAAQRVLLLGEESYFETDEVQRVESYLAGKGVVCERVSIDDVGRLSEF